MDDAQGFPGTGFDQLVIDAHLRKPGRAVIGTLHEPGRSSFHRKGDGLRWYQFKHRSEESGITILLIYCLILFYPGQGDEHQADDDPP